MKISFVDNNFQYAKCYITRNYTELAKQILAGNYELDYEKREDDFLCGYKIQKNEPLSSLYEDNYYSVRFYFANVDTLHQEKQETMMEAMMQHLLIEIEERKGYYNLRIPTHIVDLLKAYNKLPERGIFCGGTVEQYIANKEVPDNIKQGVKVFWANTQYVEKHKDLMLSMTYRSFETYQGQYHISHVTENKAGKIYENWIRNSLLENSQDLVVVAEYNGIPIGFVTVAEDDFALEGVLSAVSEEYRQYGAYKAMISYIVNSAYERGKSFITSTQFDNFIVQGVWNSLGLKPFYSIYNIHIDKRDK
ncbi:MAG: GNAT family N-acetyltransferase [Eubacterium sp.]|nr:GNAT family N-acetyltransferase [Eubacterium sp.]